MIILLCPGFNQPELNTSFRAAFAHQSYDWVVYPAPQLPPYSAVAILDFWAQSVVKTITKPEVVVIGFSAGVVGAWGAALGLSLRQINVKALIAIDGWGVPLWGNFPIHRLSHDYFTHWSSLALGGGDKNFYADPPVGHLDLWRSPQTTRGWEVNTNGSKKAIAALDFIEEIINYSP